MLTWIHRHRTIALMLGTLVALAAAEAGLLCYYLGSWATLPFP